jgi:hydroxyacylglutathione hydrolase
VYVIGDVLVDAGTRHSAKRILRLLCGRRIAAVALTHVHPDHQGGSHQICETLGVPLCCGHGDADAMEDGQPNLPKRGPIQSALEHGPLGAPHPVTRCLHEGDEVGGFTVVETPGHSPGHISFWRERDGALVIGEAINNEKLRVAQPAGFSTDSYGANRASLRKLGALRPALVCPTHGRIVRDGGRFARFVESLPK